MVKFSASDMNDLNRRDFMGRILAGVLTTMSISTFGKAEEKSSDGADQMPVLFVGHGSPMNAVEDNEFSRTWVEVGRHLPRPKAILCISAHWETEGTCVSTTSKPKTIYDFSGFPEELYKIVYPAPGSPEWAETVRKEITKAKVGTDGRMGLDHGAWVVLRKLFPAADVPVFQLSLDYRLSPQDHYAIGQQLQSLRRQGLLIIGSGNIVHNLALMEWTDRPFSWAVEFDKIVTGLIEKRDHKALVDYPALGELAKKAIPTNEHYLPLLYTLALRQEKEPLKFFNEKLTLGSISMRSFQVG